MAKLAPVVPLSMARQLMEGDTDDFGGYHLLLAHDILDKPKEYEELYATVRRRWADSFIILDNSIIELGKAMEIKDLLEAAKIVTPDCIVIPDVMGDGRQTRAGAVSFVRNYAQELVKIGPREVPIPLMGVVQGDNVAEALETLGTFYSLPLIDYIGIPRVMVKQHGSRMPFMQSLVRSPAFASTEAHAFKGFHLLGFSDDILDDVTCARVPWIQGIDSNVPVRAASKGIAVSLDDLGPTGWSVRTGPRGDFWNANLDEEAVSLARDNLREYRTWIKG